MRIRLSVTAWGSGVEDFESICVPSIAQSGNVPWLAGNGFAAVCTVYTSAEDAGRIREISRRLPAGCEAAVEIVDWAAGSAPFTPSGDWLAAECRAGVAETSAVLLLGAGAFVGNGTLRNLATYCRKPGVATFGTYLCVERERLLASLRKHEADFAGEPLSNAQLVDVGLRSGADPGSGWLPLDESLSGWTTRRFVPLMFWPDESDVAFFVRHAAQPAELLDALWQAKLVAERRWRLFASTDLAFLLAAQPVGPASDRDDEVSGREFLQQTCYVAVRREPSTR